MRMVKEMQVSFWRMLSWVFERLCAQSFEDFDASRHWPGGHGFLMVSEGRFHGGRS